MKRGFWGILFVVILWQVNVAPPAFGITADAVLTEIQNRYDRTSDLEAGFVQEYSGKMMRAPQNGQGQVYFKKKGMMRWDYRVPNQKLITNGKMLWYYQPEDSQVFVSEMSKVIKERTPLSFLAGEGHLSRDFILGKFVEAVSPKEDHHVLELIPKEPNPTLAKLVITVDKKNYLVNQVDVIDELGNMTRTRFINIKTNVVLPVSLFGFTVPPGTEVLKFQDLPELPAGGKGGTSK
jgi:outer membrane lipoprotein carrier protein